MDEVGSGLVIDDQLEYEEIWRSLSPSLCYRQERRCGSACHLVRVRLVSFRQGTKSDVDSDSAQHSTFHRSKLWVSFDHHVISQILLTLTTSVSRARHGLYRFLLPSSQPSASHPQRPISPPIQPLRNLTSIGAVRSSPRTILPFVCRSYMGPNCGVTAD